MSTDGANMGIAAERALATILGGEPEPKADEKLTREQVRQRLDKAPRLKDISVLNEGGEERHYYGGKELILSYSATADVAARAINDFLNEHPEHESAPAENEFAPDAWVGFDGDSKNFPTPIRQGLYDVMKAQGYDLGPLGLTGFMWGFAFNTARYIRYAEPAANPAIIDI